MSKIYNQTTEITRLLEMDSGIYQLKVNNIPIWWFIRTRFYRELLNYLANISEKKENSENDYIFSKKAINFNWKQGSIFLLRALSGLIRTKIYRIPQNPIAFFAYPVDFKKNEEGAKLDIFINPIYQKLPEKSVIIEYPSLGGHDFYSFLYRKNTLFFDWAILLSVLKNGFKLRKTPTIDNWDDFENRCQGINFRVIPSNWITNTIKKLIISNAGKVTVQVKAAEILFKKLNPRIIIETRSYNSGIIALNLVAKRESIPVIELQHGAISKGSYGYHCFLPINYRGEKPLPDKILVFGQAFKRVILEGGNAFLSKNITVTGSSRLSSFLNEIQLKRELIRQETRKKLEINNNIFLVILTSGTIFNSYLSQFFKKVLPLLKENIVICIKLHPMEGAECRPIYKNIVNHPKVRIVTDDMIDLYQLLVASDIHTTVCSTVLLECLALGIPNIIIKGSIKGLDYTVTSELLSRGEAIAVDTPKDFVNELNKLQKDGKYREEIIKKGEKISEDFFAKKECPGSLIVDEIIRCCDQQSRVRIGQKIY